MFEILFFILVFYLTHKATTGKKKSEEKKKKKQTKSNVSFKSHQVSNNTTMDRNKQKCHNFNNSVHNNTLHLLHNI